MDSGSSNNDGHQQQQRHRQRQRQRQRQRTMLYQCTWRGCTFQCLQCHTIEQHVRVMHLG